MHKISAFLLYFTINAYLCVSLILVIMKKRVVLLLTCLFLWVSSIFAQDVPVGVVVAFKKGNSQELNRYLGDKVDLIIHNRTTNADKQTAEI